MHVQHVSSHTITTTPAAAPATTTTVVPAALRADIEAIRAEAANAAAFAATGSCPWAGGKPPKG